MDREHIEYIVYMLRVIQMTVQLKILRIQNYNFVGCHKILRQDKYRD